MYLASVQEMANPRVRPHLEFYPEDTGGKNIRKCAQTDAWLRDADDSNLTPMVRLRGQDFFVHEPALLNDGHAVMPTRWFMRNNKLHAMVWKLRACSSDVGDSWIVEAHSLYTLPCERFAVSFTHFNSSAMATSVPPATNIRGVYIIW